MRRNFIALFFITVVILASGAAAVSATHQHQHTDAPKPSTAATQEAKTTATAVAEETKKAVTNKLCPVSGGPVSEKFRTEYKGQYVYVCCEGCLTEFKANPEKFVAKMSQEERQAITTNELCPVSKEPVSQDIWTEDHGRKVYFCCPSCKTQYEKKMAAAKQS
ncbi:MAG: YHS domain-containing protein [Acidobacteria bacterium]|nr:YHS domain-containing protein [Acidobacteriota bacterium]